MSLTLGVAALAVALDQVAKWLAVSRLDPRRPPSYLGGLLRLQLVRNSGAAFSVGSSVTWVFGVLAIVATAVIALLVVPRVRMRSWAVTIGLLLAGIVGNLIDRLLRAPGLLRGHVVDFFQLPYFAIFNVADMCITFSVVGLVAAATWGRFGIDGRAIVSHRWGVR